MQQKTKLMEPLLTSKDVARILNVSVRTVERMCDSGELEHVILKTHAGARNVKRRVSPKALDKYLASHLIPADA